MKLPKSAERLREAIKTVENECQIIWVVDDLKAVHSLIDIAEALLRDLEQASLGEVDFNRHMEDLGFYEPVVTLADGKTVHLFAFPEAPSDN